MRSREVGETWALPSRNSQSGGGGDRCTPITEPCNKCRSRRMNTGLEKQGDNDNLCLGQWVWTRIC